MKSRTLRYSAGMAFWLLVVVALTFLFVGVKSAFGQDATQLPPNGLVAVSAPVAVVGPIPSAAAGDDLTAVLVSVLDPLVVKYPWLSMAFLVIGLLRTLFKPLVSWLEARAAATPDPTDDEKLRAAEASWWFRALAWLLDFTASIKVGPQKR